MKVGLLIIAHDRLGAALMDTAVGTLGHCPLNAAVLSVSRDCDPEKTREEARRLVHEVEQGAGVIVLTDMYGSTPSNVACSLLDLPRVRVLAGVNLPMLIRVFNYPELDLDELTRKAVGGGRDGILLCETEGQAGHG